MNSTRELGRRGEHLAEAHLRGRGYQVVERNVRIGRGEIDLIAYDGGVLVFVEVKARRSLRFGPPHTSIGGKKRRQLVDLARRYLAQRRITERACRFDTVLIQWDGASAQIDLIRDAFSA